MTTRNAPAKPKTTAVANWEEKLASMAKSSVEQEASVATGQFIGTKGGQLSYNGNPVVGNKLEAIIVDAILENAYYGEDAYDPDNPAPPICYAFGRDDGEMTPHPEAPMKQADSCSECEWNKFGSADKGRGKACKNIRRLGLIPAQPLTEEAIEKAEVAFLKTPVTSVKSWAAYVRTLEALIHRPPLGVVTEISTIPDPKTQFKMIFQHKINLPNDILPKAFERYEAIKETIEFPYPKPEEGSDTTKKGSSSRSSKISGRGRK